jgi:hypothetical protein
MRVPALTNSWSEGSMPRSDVIAVPQMEDSTEFDVARFSNSRHSSSKVNCSSTPSIALKRTYLVSIQNCPSALAIE